MKAIALTALAMILTASAWAAETGPAATPSAGAGTTSVQLSEAQMDSITAGRGFNNVSVSSVSNLGIVGGTPTPQRSGFDLQYSLFGGPIFVAPSGCGGFGAQFGC